MRVLIFWIHVFLERGDDQENAEQNSTADAKSEDDSEVETPPPVPPRRRLEAAAGTADEPEAKRSRPSEHGIMSQKGNTRKSRNKLAESHYMYIRYSYYW